MKPRRVMGTLEMDTTAELKDLRDAECWQDVLQENYWKPRVHQVQVNVVKPPVKK